MRDIEVHLSDADLSVSCFDHDGLLSDKHNIVHNERLQVNVPKPQWNWWYKDIRVKTMLDYAKAAGLSTATVTWPVMAGSAADYNIAEIWAPTIHDDPTDICTQANSPAVAKIFERQQRPFKMDADAGV